MSTKEQAGQLFETVKAFVERCTEPLWTNMSTVLRRCERHDAHIEELERRINALEQKSGKKSGVVWLKQAGDK